MTNSIINKDNRGDCSQHKKDLFGELDMKKVAEAIGDLHYETLTKLFDALQVKMWHDSNKDAIDGRTKLGEELYGICAAMRKACSHSGKAWQISKPFMKSNSTK